MKTIYTTKSLSIISTLLCLVACSLLRAQPITPTYQDVSYVNDAFVYHKMDIYIPAGAVKAPTVIFIHGGGWSGGNKGGAMQWCDSLFNNGFVIVDINYRLAGDSIWPAQMYDCKAAVRFLKANASTYKIDSCRIGVTGTSAGGHLTNVLGVGNGVAFLENMNLGNSHVSSNVHAAYPLWGGSDFLLLAAHQSPKCSISYDPCSPTSSCSRLVGAAVCTYTAISQTANPITYVDPTDPPFELAHGDSDCSVPSPQSQFMYNALVANGVTAKLNIYPGYEHGNDPRWPTSTLKPNMVKFFTAYLKNINPCSSVGIVENSTIVKMDIFPNPLGSSATLSFILAKADNISIKLYDLLGNEVQKIAEGSLQPGHHSMELNAEGLANGIFLCRIQSETINSFKKIEIIK